MEISSLVTGLLHNVFFLIGNFIGTIEVVTILCVKVAFSACLQGFMAAGTGVANTVCTSQECHIKIMGLTSELSIVVNVAFGIMIVYAGTLLHRVIAPKQ